MNRLAGRQIAIPRRVDWVLLNSLGVAGSVRAVLEKHVIGEEGGEYYVCRAWERVFNIDEILFRELILEFVATFTFDSATAREECYTECMRFRLGGVWRSLSLAEFGVALGIYTQAEIEDPGFEDYMIATEKVQEEFDPRACWTIIGDGAYNSNIKVKGLLSSIDRLLHRMLVHAVNSRSSSEEKISTYDLWLLDRLSTDDKYPNAPYIIAAQLIKASGYREGSKLLGGQYVTRLARHFGVLTQDAIASMTNLGAMGLLDIGQLRGLGVVQPVPTSQGVQYEWDPHPQSQRQGRDQRQSRRSVPESTFEQGGTSGAAQHQQPEDWDPYTSYQGLSQQLSEMSLAYGQHHQHMEYNSVEALHQANWQSGVLNQMASQSGIQPASAFAASPYWPYPDPSPPGYQSFEDWRNQPRGPY